MYVPYRLHEELETLEANSQKSLEELTDGLDTESE